MSLIGVVIMNTPLTYRFTRLLSVAAMAATVAALGSQAASAQEPTMKEEKPGLLAKATISPEAARSAALALVPKGKIAEQEIEVENGKLAYSFDIKVPGRTGIEEVLIDAKTGAVISHEHEGPKAEAAERAKDAREAKRKQATP